MTTQQLVNYYANLLILQYIGEPKAYATIQAVATQALIPQTTVQAIALSGIAASGTFELTYGAQTTAAINWNDSLATIQGKLQALTGLGSVTIAGSIASKLLTVTFTGVAPVALPLGVTANSLMTSAPAAIGFTFTQTDLILPLAVQTGFNLTGSSLAIGAQLDILGKYAGVKRTGTGLQGQPITLSDSDFLKLIQLAIATNSDGSDLHSIQAVLQLFFANEIFVFDHKNMRMSYFINSTFSSLNLVQLFITEGLLPKPMGVQLAAPIFAPALKFFGMVSAQDVATYAAQNSVSIGTAANAIMTADNITPLNTAAAPTTTVWLSAQLGVPI